MICTLVKTESDSKNSDLFQRLLKIVQNYENKGINIASFFNSMKQNFKKKIIFNDLKEK
jgi:hypothetical protein